MKNFFALGLIAGLSFLLAGCETMDSAGGGGASSAPAANLLRVGVTPNAAPMIY